jgi:hypothetical protein
VARLYTILAALRGRGRDLQPPPSRPAIVWAIPFGAERKSQMHAYSNRHCGTASGTHPAADRQHYTASNSFSSAYWTFHGTRPTRMHELPVCALHRP